MSFGSMTNAKQGSGHKKTKCDFRKFHLCDVTHLNRLELNAESILYIR